MKRNAYRQHATEAGIQLAICDYLAWHKIPFAVTDASRHWDAKGRVRRSRVTTGWPDLTICLPPNGRMLCVEVKGPRGRLRSAQSEMLGRLHAAGALVVVARSVEDVITLVNGEARRKSA